MSKYWIMALLLFVLAACALRGGQPFMVGDELLSVDFSQANQWEQYTNLDQHVDFRIEDGEYRARAWDNGITWALNSTIHTDAVIQVDTEQLSADNLNAYGLMCRASPTNNGDGYYFLISGDGNYTLRRGATDTIHAIIPWTGTGAIQQGQSINRIRAVCIGDYLALYVNGQFVAEARDRRFTRGYAGLSAAAPADVDVEVIFDNLRVWAAAME